MGTQASGAPTRADLPFVGSLKELQQDHGSYIGAPIGKALGLVNFGVHHETILPGGWSSKPHAHSKDEEYVFVVKGRPSLWLDGHLIQLDPGDSAAFPAGTGIAHAFFNNTDVPIELLIVGEHWPDDRVTYPVHSEAVHPRPWTDAPKRPLGPHDGRTGSSC